MKKTQVERVHDYINQFGSITSWEAYTDLGITQLGARIWELKKAGFLIKTTPIYLHNRFGEKIRVVSYSWQNSDNPQVSEAQ